MSNQQLKQSNSKLAKDLKKDIGRLGRLQSTVEYHTIETRDTKLIATDTTIIIEKQPKSTKKVSYYDKWLSFEGLYYQDTFLFNYQAINSIRLNTYWKRQGIFKPKMLHVQMKTDNPHLDTRSLKAIVVQDKKKWWERRGVLFAAGVFAGLGTALYLR